MSQVAKNGYPQQTALVAVGSNQGFGGKDQYLLIFWALRQIETAFDDVAEISRVYRTPAFPAGNGPDFANAVIRFRTRLPAGDVLQQLHRIEQDAGRERSRRWGPRTLDLDLLAMGDSILPDVETWTAWHDLPPALQLEKTPDRLILPHPRLQDRAFVLVPLCDVAPDWRHPVLGQTASVLCAALPQGARDEISPWT